MSQTLPVFAGVAFIAIATPGPTVLLALRNGSRYGVRASVAGMLGAIASDILVISVVAVGLGALLSSSEVGFKTVKWVGAYYLTYLGVRLLYSKGRFAFPDKENKAQQTPLSKIFLRSFLVAVTNPKSFLFFLALVPQFVSPDRPTFVQYASLALIVAALDFAIMLAYATVGAQAMWFMRAKGVLWLDRLCGCALLALAASLALYESTATGHDAGWGKAKP